MPIFVSPKPVFKRCFDCKRAFELTPEEQVHFRELQERWPERTWALPNRCNFCRDARQRAAHRVVNDEPEEAKAE